MHGALVLLNAFLPFAHEAETWLGDDEGWVWVFYVMPVFIVIGGTVASARAARRHRRETRDDERRR